MKTKLLFTLLIATSLGFSQTFDNIPTGTGYYINKLIVSPNGNDMTNELIEIRGTANAVVPSDLWLIAIEGDPGTSNYGRVSEEIQLGDGVRTFGSNGILAIVANYTDDNGAGGQGDPETPDTSDDVLTQNPYTALISSDATVITVEITGGDVTSGSSSAVRTTTPDIGYDGNFSDATGSYMLIQGSDPDNIFIDGPSGGDGLAFDGIIDATGPQTSWTLYDSVAYMDDDLEGSGIERTYAQIVFAQDMTTNGAGQTATTSATVIDYNFGTTDPHIIFRQGTSTGYTISDWVIGDTSGSSPDWELDSDTLPAAFEGWADINTVYGALNPTAASLSTKDISISDFKVFPNPAQDQVEIKTNVEISSISVFDLLGKEVSKTKLIDNMLNVSNLSKGVYLLKIEAGNKSITTKLIKN